ncbi:MAG: Trk system potassium transporter TrkA [Eubacteriales bacterium]|jgi:trk system potassium uptake protein TrkA|nr:Trk system potassium transporter TrkA [Eubacteriales bacterium]MDD3290080.1 Trk system potassium transporter TrkA [Eubacteriales bacterium]MDD3863057.1 Trk system potassium transporter TrkA [Eubacteriales bacterium]MDD4445623.1 Trk system potassium transporter TrkA [Eubacteriales bacterium]
MKVAVVGAGKLGMTITEALLGGDNEVTLIDKDEALIQKVASRLDILTVTANAKRIDVMKEIRIWEYDLLVSVVDEDEKNIVICSFAKRLGCPQVIARVRSPEHVEQIDFIKKVMNIDYIVNPDMACASEIYKYLVEKYTLTDGIYTADGVSILEFKVDKIPVLIGKEIRQTTKVLSNMLVGAISRSGKIIVPNGLTVLEAGDTIYVIGLERKIKDLAIEVHEKKRYTDLARVMIAGGGKTGYYLAKKLSDFGVAVKIIEIDRERCEYLTDRLNNVLVLHGDATDPNLLHEENLEEMDAFVAVTGFDEENLLLSLLAKQQNIEDVVAKVSRKSYAALIENLGVNMTINPMDMCATNILRFIQKSGIVIFSQLIQGQAEFTEIWAEKGMPITDRTLSELDIPEGVIIAAIHRNNEIIIPSGNTKIQDEDRVVILSLLSSIPLLEALIKQPRAR